jgi:hypothetical protein
MDRVTFRQQWERTEIFKRDRSLEIVAALIAMNRPDQLRVMSSINSSFLTPFSTA